MIEIILEDLYKSGNPFKSAILRYFNTAGEEPKRVGNTVCFGDQNFAKEILE